MDPDQAKAAVAWLRWLEAVVVMVMENDVARRHLANKQVQVAGHTLREAMSKVRDRLPVKLCRARDMGGAECIVPDGHNGAHFDGVKLFGEDARMMVQ